MRTKLFYLLTLASLWLAACSTPARCALTIALQRAAAEFGQPPLLIREHQQGGTLVAIADATPVPGNLALGALASPGLARWAAWHC
jgi:beta-glucosidase-like glycosyl hydrolase